jgi:hypothetical protein
LEIRDLAALVGMVTGIAGFTLSIINYRREEPSLNIKLSWNDFHYTDDFLDKTKYVTKVTIANSGRRSVYISDVKIIIPEKYNTDYKTITLSQRVTGVKLDEGESPELFEIGQNSFESWLKPKLLEFPDMQEDIVAEATDSTGRKYYSKPCKTKIKFGSPGL